jgi:DNA-directed RNA polymerase subunit H (RpoH/RPB5)
MRNDSDEVLETLRRIEGLLELLAEDKIAQRDAKLRATLVEIVGSSPTKQKSIYFMDGTKRRLRSTVRPQ